MSKTFASAGDMEEKTISFTQIGEGLYAFTAEGDPNSGVIIGDGAECAAGLGVLEEDGEAGDQGAGDQAAEEKAGEGKGRGKDIHRPSIQPGVSRTKNRTDQTDRSDRSDRTSGLMLPRVGCSRVAVGALDATRPAPRFRRRSSRRPARSRWFGRSTWPPNRSG